jgi:SpoVK/Ycf46/Vps4 family AAA+-type ATPase
VAEHFCLTHPELAIAYADAMITLIELKMKRAVNEDPALLPELSSREAALSQQLEHVRQEARKEAFELPDDRVARIYGLTPVERDLLWLAVAPHLDPDLRPYLARLNNSLLQDYVDGALCMRLLCGSRQERLITQRALRSGGMLLAAGLLSMNPRDGGTANMMLFEIVPAGHLVSFFGGARALTPSLSSVGRWIHPAVTVEEIPLEEGVKKALFPLLAGFLERPAPRGSWYSDGGVDFPRGVAVLLFGPAGSGRTLSLKAIAGSLGRDLVLVNGRRLGEANRNHAVQCLAALCQEAELYGELVVIRDAAELIGAGKPLAAVLANRIAQHACAIVLCTDEEPVLDPSLENVVLLRQQFAPEESKVSPTYLWQVNVPGECIIPSDLDFEQTVGRVNLTPAQVRKAAHMAYLLAPPNVVQKPLGGGNGAARGDGSGELGGGGAPVEDEFDGLLLNREVLDYTARAQVSGSSMGHLAEVADAALSLEDVILPDDTLDQIQQILSAVRNRQMVLRNWGLSQRIHRGTGICCLFDGDPGTGKTLCAEVIATELQLTLLRVNIAGIVDKYIGETEKNLTRVFSRARPDIHMLLFDEADSLFSKRTEVSRSTDRYSNMDINVLLQLVERYEGITVLTTNLKKSIDAAFERRFAFKVSFPVPDKEERRRIWLHLLPETIPTAEAVDYEFLSTIELTGGEIKNAIMRGAYRAAHEGKLIDLDHLIAAARKEASAAGRLVRGDWDATKRVGA